MTTVRIRPNSEPGYRHYLYADGELVGWFSGGIVALIAEQYRGAGHQAVAGRGKLPRRLRTAEREPEAGA